MWLDTVKVRCTPRRGGPRAVRGRFGRSAAGSRARAVTHARPRARAPRPRRQVRLQLAPPGAPTSLVGMLLFVARTEGIGGLFGGLTPALLRQASYQSIKMGTFDPIKAAIAKAARVPSNEAMPFWILALAGGLAGAIGTVIATPTEIAKVRLQAGASGGVFGALSTLHAEGGIIGLWLHPSIVPNVQRSFVVNAAELAACVARARTRARARRSDGRRASGAREPRVRPRLARAPPPLACARARALALEPPDPVSSAEPPSPPARARPDRPDRPISAASQVRVDEGAAHAHAALARVHRRARSRRGRLRPVRCARINARRHGQDAHDEW